MLEGKKANIRLGGDFSPVPMDKYTLQIADVSWVTQLNKWKNIEEDLLNYQFVILDEKPMPGNPDGSEAGTTRGRFLWQRCSQSLGPKAKLRELVFAVVGREMTKEEMEAFDPESIVGKQVDAMVKQEPSKDGTKIYNNIVSFGKTVKQLEIIADAIAGQQPTISKSSTPAVAPNPAEYLDQMDKEAGTEDLEKAAEVAAEKAKEVEA